MSPFELPKGTGGIPHGAPCVIESAIPNPLPPEGGKIVRLSRAALDGVEVRVTQDFLDDSPQEAHTEVLFGETVLRHDSELEGLDFEARHIELLSRAREFAGGVAVDGNFEEFSNIEPPIEAQATHSIT